jgi:hypothetical protein
MIKAADSNGDISQFGSIGIVAKNTREMVVREGL